MKKFTTIMVSMMYIAFGLGSLPDAPLSGGLLVIGLLEHEPVAQHRVTNDSVYLFSFEM